MPKLYEYFGLIVFFYANEHLPIHVHGRVDEREMKASFEIVEGVILAIHFSAVRGKEELKPKEFKRFKTLVEAYQLEIVQKWVDFFVHHKQVSPQQVTRELD